MIANGVKIATKISEHQYDIGFKGQGHKHLKPVNSSYFVDGGIFYIDIMFA